MREEFQLRQSQLHYQNRSEHGCSQWLGKSWLLCCVPLSILTMLRCVCALFVYWSCFLMPQSGGEASIVAELVEVEKNSTSKMQTLRIPPVITVNKTAAYALYELTYIRVWCSSLVYLNYSFFSVSYCIWYFWHCNCCIIWSESSDNNNLKKKYRELWNLSFYYGCKRIVVVEVWFLYMKVWAAS